MQRKQTLNTFLLILGLCTIAPAIQAQDSTKTTMKTLFGGKGSADKSAFKIRHLGVFVAPEFQMGQLNGGFVPTGAMSFMLQVNKKWGVGVSSAMGRREGATSTSNFRAAFGGLKLEYTPKPDAAVHVSFPLIIGGARSDTGSRGFMMGGNRGNSGRKNDDDNDRMDGRRGGGRSYALIQPGINIETNLFRFARLYAGANYRFVFSENGYSSAMQGFSASVGLKVGIFDYALGSKRVRAKKKSKRDM